MNTQYSLKELPKKRSSSTIKNANELPLEYRIFQEIEYGINIDESIIYIHGDIMMGNLFDIISKTRIILNNRPKKCAKDPINVYINTNGGDVYEALGIIDFFESLPVKVNIFGTGRVISAGAMILVNATGKRVVSKNTTIMLHQTSAEFSGNAADIKSNADHMEAVTEDFFTVLAAKTAQPRAFWEKNLRKDFYVNADKAKELGLIDEII